MNEVKLFINYFYYSIIHIFICNSIEFRISFVNQTKLDFSLYELWTILQSKTYIYSLIIIIIVKLAANAAGALGAKIKFIKLGKINVLYRIKCHVPLSSLIGALRAPPGGRGAKPPPEPGGLGPPLGGYAPRLRRPRSPSGPARGWRWAPPEGLGDGGASPPPSAPLRPPRGRGLPISLIFSLATVLIRYII